MSKAAHSRKLTIGVLIVCGILLISMVSCSIYVYRQLTWKVRDKNRIIKLLDYVDENYEDTLRLTVAVISDENSLSCCYNGPDSIKQFDQIRILYNQFLTDNPNYFLNDGYTITVTFQNPPLYLAEISNSLYKSEDKYYNELSCMRLYNPSNFKFSDFEGNCKSLRALIVYDLPISTGVEALQTLPNLEYVGLNSLCYKDQDLKTIQKLLPDSDVEYYSNENTTTE